MRDDVPGTGERAQPLRDRLDELDTGAGAEAVVDGCQVVDLDGDDRDATHLDVTFGEPDAEPVEVEHRDTRRVGPVRAPRRPSAAEASPRASSGNDISVTSTGSRSWLTSAAARRARFPARMAAMVAMTATVSAATTAPRSSGFTRVVSSHCPPGLSLHRRRRARQSAVCRSRPTQFGALLVDFYGTLARDVSPFHIDTVMRERGYTLPDHLREIWWNGDVDGIEHGDESLSREHYVAWQRGRLLSMLGEADVHPGEHEAIIAELQAGHAARALEPYPEAATVLGELRRRGVRVAICSNWDWDLEPAVTEAGLRGLRRPSRVVGVGRRAEAASQDLPVDARAARGARGGRGCSSATRGAPTWKARARSASRRCTWSGTATGPTPPRPRPRQSTRVR